MNGTILCLAIRFLCFGPIPAVEKYPLNSLYTGDTVVWSPTYKLSFEDFKGAPKAEDTTKRIDTSAVSSTGIRYHIKHDHNKMKIEAYAIFLKRQSWIRNRTEDVLEHERGHFDITMIYARKLENMVNNQEIEVGKKKTFYDFLDASYEKLRLEWKIKQDEFDREATTKEGEQEGFKWINEQLNLLMLK